MNNMEVNDDTLSIIKKLDEGFLKGPEIPFIRGDESERERDKEYKNLLARIREKVSPVLDHERTAPCSIFGLDRLDATKLYERLLITSERRYEMPLGFAAVLTEVTRRIIESIKANLEISDYRVGAYGSERKENELEISINLTKTFNENKYKKLVSKFGKLTWIIPGSGKPFLNIIISPSDYRNQTPLINLLMEYDMIK